MGARGFPTSSVLTGIFLMPSSSTLLNSVSTGEDDGMYIAIVVADPKPAAPSGGIFLNRLASFLSSSIPTAVATPCVMDGRDALVLRNLLTGSVDEGLGTLAAAKGRALGNTAGSGGVGGGGVGLDVVAGCQRSNTDDFLAVRGLFGGLGGPGGATAEFSNCELIFTIL